MVKHPACAAAISSSGLVPDPLSKREVKEYGVALRTVLSVESVPFPDFRLPCQTADALRFMAQRNCAYRLIARGRLISAVFSRIPEKLDSFILDGDPPFPIESPNRLF